MTPAEIKATAKGLYLSVRGLRAIAEDAQLDLPDCEETGGYGEGWSEYDQQIRELKAVEAYLQDLGN